MLQAIPTYDMSCFRVPATICSEMEKICANFWWEGEKHMSGLHWKTWDFLCMNREEGGLGFKRFTCFNQALLAKQVWRILTNPQSLLTQVFKSRYFRSIDVMQAQLGSNPSFVWRSICWGRELLKLGIKWRVAKGTHIDAGLRN